MFSGASILGGIMVDSGIFYLGSYVLMRVSMVPRWAILAWIIGSLVSMLGGLCYAALGASLPRAEGTTIYLNETYHPVVDFMSGFSSWLLRCASSISAIAVAFARMLKGAAVQKSKTFCTAAPFWIIFS